MENKFTVRVLVIAQEMMKNGCKCIGAHICDRGYVEFEFERKKEVIKAYQLARQTIKY